MTDDARQRQLESLAFEATYWQELTLDLQAAHGLVGEIGGLAADALVEGTDALLGLALLRLIPGTPDTETISAAVKRAGNHLAELVPKLEALQEKLVAIADLAGGRVNAMREEANLPPHEEESS